MEILLVSLNLVSNRLFRVPPIPGMIEETCTSGMTSPDAASTASAKYQVLKNLFLCTMERFVGFFFEGSKRLQKYISGLEDYQNYLKIKDLKAKNLKCLTLDD